MSHQLDLSNNRANMAYVKLKPWHGLGQELPLHADIDTWKVSAGLNWEAIEAPALYQDPESKLTLPIPGKKILLRSDTRAPLSVVGSGYHPVQPGEILEFYQDLISESGFHLETAGSLKGGKRIWALAKTGMNLNLGNVDLIKGYLLLATSFDGTMSTVATYTSVRVVCWNTLTLSVGSDGSKADIRISHGRKFNSLSIKAQLGLVENSWKDFGDQSKELSKRKVSREEAVRYFLDLVAPVEEGEEIPVQDLDIASTRVKNMLDVYNHGVGQNLVTSQDTAWGLVNAVTRFYDHESNTRTPDNRLDSAWFGQGSKIKTKAWNKALELI